MTSLNNKKVNIVEVGPRDGLQNIKTVLPLEKKIKLIQNLLDSGLKHIEAGSFVREDKVPAMAGSADIAKHFKKEDHRLWYLAPNLKGLEKALESGARQIAFFTATSETFNTKNIGMTVDKSVETIQKMMDFLKDDEVESQWNESIEDNQKLKLRLYISTVISCPYDGDLDPQKTIDLMNRLLSFGFAQVSLGDTIGKGSPEKWEKLLKLIDPKLIQEDKIAMHCHDTYNTALDCVSTGLDFGVRTFDSSIGGLGGCPFAPGAKGNLSTKDLLSCLRKKDFETSVKNDELIQSFLFEEL